MRGRQEMAKKRQFELSAGDSCISLRILCDECAIYHSIFAPIYPKMVDICIVYNLSEKQVIFYECEASAIRSL